MISSLFLGVSCRELSKKSIGVVVRPGGRVLFCAFITYLGLFVQFFLSSFFVQATFHTNSYIVQFLNAKAKKKVSMVILLFFINKN